MDNFDLSSVNAESEGIVDSQEAEQASTSTESVNEEVTTSQQSEKPVQSAEENAKFATIRREYEAKIEQESQKAIDAEYSRLYGEEYNIHSKADYDRAVAQQAQQDREDAIRQEYESRGVPDELLDELVASKRDREEREVEKQTKAQEAKQQADYLEFFDYFKSENGRDFDVSKDTIAKEVWQEVSKGIPLKIAYALSENATLKSKLKAIETNQSNAESSTGSLTGNGSAKDLTLTDEMVENMSTSELAKRWNEVKTLYNMK